MFKTYFGSSCLIVVSNVGLSSTTNGALRSKVEEPLTTGTLYPIQWRELRVNLAELAKLRFIDGWSRKQLAEHFGRTEIAIQYYFQIIKKKNIRSY